MKSMNKESGGGGGGGGSMEYFPALDFLSVLPAEGKRADPCGFPGQLSPQKAAERDSPASPENSRSRFSHPYTRCWNEEKNRRYGISFVFGKYPFTH